MWYAYACNHAANVQKYWKNSMNAISTASEPSGILARHDSRGGSVKQSRLIAVTIQNCGIVPRRSECDIRDGRQREGRSVEGANVSTSEAEREREREKWRRRDHEWKEKHETKRKKTNRT